MRLSESGCIKIARYLVEDRIDGKAFDDCREFVEKLRKLNLSQADLDGGIVFTLEEAKALLMKNGSSGAHVTTRPKTTAAAKSPPPNPSTGFKGW